VLNWLFGYTNKKEETIESGCEHNGRWEVWGTNTIGSGQCRECGREVNLSILIGNSAKRLNNLIAAHDEDKHERVAGRISDAA
jgi:hypothetical protein